MRTISRRDLPVTLLLLALSLTAYPVFAQREVRLTTDDVLEHVRTAIGYDAFKLQRFWKIMGHVKAYDIDTTFTLRFGTDGRFVEKIDGALGETCGYDGKVAWQVDSTGMPL